MTMHALSARDLRAILNIVRMVNDEHHGIEMPLEVLARLGALVGCESLGYSRVDLISGRLLTSVHDPAEADLIHLPGLHMVFHQHPGFAAYRSGRLAPGSSVALSDLADQRALRRLPLHVDYHRPYGINEQLLCAVHQSGTQGAALSFNRQRPKITSRDRAVVELITPHLVQALTHRQRVASLSAMIRRQRRHLGQVDDAVPRLALLTSREREVVEHIVGGVTDRDIARSMVISIRTVHKHLENIYRKLNITNRTSLITLTHRETANIF